MCSCFTGQITANQSLFTYKPGQSVDTFRNVSFVPMFADALQFYNDSVKQAAYKACGNDFSCLFDAAATNDVSVGVSSKETSENFVNDSNILGEKRA